MPFHLTHKQEDATFKIQGASKEKLPESKVAPIHHPPSSAMDAGGS
jgi:hypothetical protein